MKMKTIFKKSQLLCWQRLWLWECQPVAVTRGQQILLLLTLPVLPEQQQKRVEKTTAAVDNSDIKIGVSIWSSTDVLGSQCKLILDAAAEALGVQVQYRG